MEIVSEQQTFVKLRIAPSDCKDWTDDEWNHWVVELRGQREKEPGQKKIKAPKDPNAPKAGRKPKGVGSLDDFA